MTLSDMPRAPRYPITRFVWAVWWRRERVGSWFPAVSRGDPELEDFLAERGFR